MNKRKSTESTNILILGLGGVGFYLAKRLVHEGYAITAIESDAGDSIAIRPVGVPAQSFDHRAFDGAYSAAFLNRLREILEEKDWSAEMG